jgi:hypothetical protein
MAWVYLLQTWTAPDGTTHFPREVLEVDDAGAARLVAERVALLEDNADPGNSAPRPGPPSWVGGVARAWDDGDTV